MRCQRCGSENRVDRVACVMCNLSIMASAEIDRSFGAIAGRGLASAGKIISVASLGLALVSVLIAALG